jgi:hypothetical protein
VTESYALLSLAWVNRKNLGSFAVACFGLGGRHQDEPW